MRITAMELTGRDRGRATASGRRPPGPVLDKPAPGGRHSEVHGGRQLIARPLDAPIPSCRRSPVTY
jgi:hypothetical protein